MASKKDKANEWIVLAQTLIKPLMGQFVTVKFSRFTFEDLEIDKLELASVKYLGNRALDKRPNSDGNGMYTPPTAILFFKSGEELRLDVENTRCYATMHGVTFRITQRDGSFIDLELTK